METIPTPASPLSPLSPLSPFSPFSPWIPWDPAAPPHPDRAAMLTSRTDANMSANIKILFMITIPLSTNFRDVQIRNSKRPYSKSAEPQTTVYHGDGKKSMHFADLGRKPQRFFTQIATVCRRLRHFSSVGRRRRGRFLYRTESRNALLAVITFAVLLCFRPRRRRAEGKELNSRTDIWEPAFRLAFRIARREKPP